MVLTSVANDKPIVVATVNEQARDRGLKSGELVRAAARILRGGGGGKDDIAQGGGNDPLAIPGALSEVTRLVASRAAEG